MKTNLDQQIEAVLQSEDVSDLHITEGEPMWGRELGLMKRYGKNAVSSMDIVDWLAGHKDEHGIESSKIHELLNKHGDRDFACKINNMRFRANIFRANGHKLSLALRRLSQNPPSIETLGLPESVEHVANQSKGLVLVTGATGSGKSTTLASIVEHLNATASRHIITLEDPVEYLFSNKKSLIAQRQVGRDTKDFPSGLRAALRQDPDVVLIGEMRDRETVETALNAANTGHLVLATLHTMNARQSIERIASFFDVDEKRWISNVVSAVLVGILSQVLIPDVTRKNRVLCAEVLVNTPAISQLIREGKFSQIFNAMETGRREGQQLLNFDLAEKIRRGTISYEDALYYTYDPGGLERELN